MLDKPRVQDISSHRGKAGSSSDVLRDLFEEKGKETFETRVTKNALKKADNRASGTSWRASERFKTCVRVAGLLMLGQAYAAKTHETGAILTINTEHSPTNLHIDTSVQPLHYDSLFPQSNQSKDNPIAHSLYKQFEKIYPPLKQRWDASDAFRRDIQLNDGFTPPARDKLFYWSVTPVKHIEIKFDSNIKAIAEFQSNRFSDKGSITFNSDYIKNNPLELEGLFVHELTHAVQKYPDQVSDVTHFREGIADYARYKYGPENDNWSLSPLELQHNYTDGYKVTARFLVWLEQNKNDRIVDNLNYILKRGEFSEDVFVHWTGKTVDELWTEYSRSEPAKQAGDELYKQVATGIVKGLFVAAAFGMTGIGLAEAGRRIFRLHDSRRLPPSDEEAQQSQQSRELFKKQV